MVRGIFKWRVLITKRIVGACLLRDVCEYGRLSGDAIQMVYIKKIKVTISVRFYGAGYPE